MHTFLEEEFGADYQLKNPAGFAVFEDHGGVLTAITPKSIGAPLRPDTRTALPWLWRRLKGENQLPKVTPPKGA